MAARLRTIPQRAREVLALLTLHLNVLEYDLTLPHFRLIDRLPRGALVGAKDQIDLRRWSGIEMVPGNLVIAALAAIAVDHAHGMLATVVAGEDAEGDVRRGAANPNHALESLGNPFRPDKPVRRERGLDLRRERRIVDDRERVGGRL